MSALRYTFALAIIVATNTQVVSVTEVHAQTATAVEATDVNTYSESLRVEVRSILGGNFKALTSEQVKKLTRLWFVATQKSEAIPAYKTNDDLQYVINQIGNLISSDKALQRSALGEAEFVEFSRDKSNDGLPPEAIALKQALEQRMSGPLMEQFTYATALIAYANYCNSYDNSFADIDLSSVAERREVAWQAMEIPAEVGEQVRNKIESNVKATLSNTRPKECPKNRQTAETMLQIIFAD